MGFFPYAPAPEGGGGGPAAVQLGTSTEATATVDTATSRGETLPNSGVAHTKGAWEELIASTDGNVCALLLSFNLSTTERYIIELGIGAGGSEAVLVPNICLGFPSAFHVQMSRQLCIPVSVASGVRIAGRIQTSGTAGTADVSVTAVIGTLSDWNTVDAYGVNVAATQGTNVDAGAVGNTKGAWAEMSASCNAVNGLIVAVTTIDVSIGATTYFLIDIGTGADPGEAVLIGNIFAVVGTNEVGPLALCYIPVTIAAGTRLVMRAQCSSTTDGDRDLHCALYGLRAA